MLSRKPEKLLNNTPKETFVRKTLIVINFLDNFLFISFFGDGSLMMYNKNWQAKALAIPVITSKKGLVDGVLVDGGEWR